MISRGQKQGRGGQTLGNEKTNGLVGSKNRGRANIRKKEKTNRLVGPKTRGGVCQPKEKKEKTNGLVGAKNRGLGGPT